MFALPVVYKIGANTCAYNMCWTLTSQGKWIFFRADRCQQKQGPSRKRYKALLLLCKRAININKMHLASQVHPRRYKTCLLGSYPSVVLRITSQHDLETLRSAPGVRRNGSRPRISGCW